MIVPRSRLLWWIGLVALPLATIGGVVPETAALSAGVITLLLLFAIVDAVRAQARLEGITVELPGVIRLAKDREGTIELRIKKPRPGAKRVRLGLPLPPEIQSEQDDILADLPADSSLSRLDWRCTPNKRGNYALDKCYLETGSPWGFWAVRNVASARAQIRVYPNLMTERRSVAALFLNRGGFGVHAQRQVGQGRDFEKLREYIPGDSFDEIHWRATAKRGKPVTKVFQIERTQEIYVIIDASRLSGRIQSSALRVSSSELEKGVNTHDSEPGTRNPEPTQSVTTTLERFITAALVLGLAAEQHGDLFGVLTFSDKVHQFVRAKNGKAHYSACRDAVYALQPQIVTPSFDELCAFIRLRLRRRALLVILTALDDPVLAESFVQSIKLICRQHLVLVNMLQPPGVQPMFSGADVESLDDLYQRLGGHVRWHDLNELEKVLQRQGVRLSLLGNERLSAELVGQYVGVKQRQLI